MNLSDHSDRLIQTFILRRRYHGSEEKEKQRQEEVNGMVMEGASECPPCITENLL